MQNLLRAQAGHQEWVAASPLCVPSNRAQPQLLPRGCYQPPPLDSCLEGRNESESPVGEEGVEVGGGMLP